MNFVFLVLVSLPLPKPVKLWDDNKDGPAFLVFKIFGSSLNKTTFDSTRWVGLNKIFVDFSSWKASKYPESSLLSFFP